MFAPVYGTLRRYAWRGGRALYRNLDVLEASQWLPPGELRAAQERKLAELLDYARRHSRFYADRFAAAGVNPNEATVASDLLAISPIRRADVRENLNTIVSRDPALGRTFTQATGGTSGEPLRFPMDGAMSWWSAAIQVRGRGWYGVTPGDRQSWLWGAPRELPDGDWRGKVKAGLKRRRFHNAVRLDEASLDDFAESLLRWRPRLLRAYPAALEVFARHLQRREIRDIRPALVEVTAETLTPGQAELFRTVFSAPVANCYSCRELLDVAYPCPEGRMHIAEPFVVEILDDHGQSVGGDVGHVTITSLEQRATPFIRYQPGDIGELDLEPCPCGRSMPTLRRLLGRKEDMIVLSDGSRTWGGVFNNIFADLDAVQKYQVVQSEPGRLTVRVELRAPVTPQWTTQVARQVDNYFGGKVESAVEIVDMIDFTAAGKIRTVVSTA